MLHCHGTQAWYTIDQQGTYTIDVVAHECPPPACAVGVAVLGSPFTVIIRAAGNDPTKSFFYGPAIGLAIGLKLGPPPYGNPLRTLS